jgi:hypothetical protein
MRSLLQPLQQLDSIEERVVPGAESNHRHADFQSDIIRGCRIAYTENSVKPAGKNQILTSDLSNPSEHVGVAVGVAAKWLSQHRDEITGPAIPFVQRRFNLTIREAIDALKKGHQLRYGG